MESIDLLKILAAVLALMVAIVGHEIMHGLVAYIYGDTTAKNAGRLSMNPLVHIDLVGTIIVPIALYFMGGFLFGWAKPVPINTSTIIRNGGYQAAMQVDLAGITYNLFLATIFSIIFTSMLPSNLIETIVQSNPDVPLLNIVYFIINKLAQESIILYFVGFSMLLNIFLAIFNLLPIPQFDGAHFIMHLSLKYKVNSVAEFFYKSERYGIFIGLIILMTPLKNYLLLLPVQTILQLLL